MAPPNQQDQAPALPPMQGEDTIGYAIANSKGLDDATKDQIWGAYHTQGTHADFAHAIQKLPVNDDVRDVLWNNRIYGKTKVGPADTNPAQHVPVKGEPTIGPAAPEGFVGHLQRSIGDSAVGHAVEQTMPNVANFLGIRPQESVYSPTYEQNTQQAVNLDALLPSGRIKVAGQDVTGAAHGAAQFAGSLTTGENLGIMAATGGLGTFSGVAGKILPRVATGYFTVQMAKSLYTQYPQFKDAMDKGDVEEAQKLATQMILTGYFIKHGAADAYEAGAEVTKGSVGEQQNILAHQIREGQVPPTMGPSPTVERPTTLPSQPPSVPVAPKIAPAIAPEPVPSTDLSSLAPKHQEIAKQIEQAAPAPTAGVAPEEEASRRIVEDAGGKWKGVDSSGVAHFETPGTDRVIDLPSDQVTRDIVQQQFQRKAQELAPKPVTPDMDVETRLQTIQANTFKEVVDLKNKREAATDDATRADIDKQLEGATNRLHQIMDMRISNSSPEMLQGMRDEHARQAAWYKAREQQVNMLQDVTDRNTPIATDISKDRATRPNAEAYSEQTGEKMQVEKGTTMGPIQRRMADLAQNRAPRYQWEDFQFHKTPKNMSDEEWNTFASARKADIQERELALRRDYEVIKSTQADPEDFNFKGRMDELEQDARMIGSFDKHLQEQKRAGLPVAVGRRPHLAPPVDEQGNITDPAALWKMDGKTWARLTQKKTTTVPKASEVRQFATNQGILGDLHDRAKAHVEQVLNPLKAAGAKAATEMEPYRDPQAGFAGDREAKVVPPSKELVKRAIKEGLPAHMIDETHPPGIDGWITSDGKGWLGKNSLSDTHAKIASIVLDYRRSAGNAVYDGYEAMLADGAIRVDSGNGPNDSPIYQVHDLTSKLMDRIEMHTIESGRHGHQIIIDTAGKEGSDIHGTQSLVLERGWDKDRFETAIAKAKREQGWVSPSSESYDIGDLDAQSSAGTAQAGFSKASIPTRIAAAGIGGTIGLHLGGPMGGTFGAVLGAISPELLKGKFTAIKPFVNSMSIAPHDWLYGPKQPPPSLPEMADILDAQRRDPTGSGLNFLDRVGQLPAKATTLLLDKFHILNDQRTGFTNYLSRLDTRLPQGARPSIDNSPYVTLADAATTIGGQQKFLMIQFKNIYNAALKSQLGNELQSYLNLKGYKRTYEIIAERMQEGLQRHQEIQQELADPKLSALKRHQLEDERKSVEEDLIAAKDKYQSGKAVPGNGQFTPQSIPLQFERMKQAIGADKFAQVEQWAKQVFMYNRKALDLAHDNEMMTDEVYQKLIARGDEYVNMSRIMDDLAQNYARYDKQGKASPLYVRKQHIINTLEGSERVNKNPMESNLMMNWEMTAEGLKNKVIKGFVDVAKQDPHMYGESFKPVGANYQAKQGEAIITHYEKGVPKLYKVSSDIYAALQGAAPIHNDFTSVAMQRFNTLFRVGAVGLNLAFHVRNVGTDIMRTAELSDVQMKGNMTKFGKYWAKNFYASLAKNDEWLSAIRQGYLQSGLQRTLMPEEGLDYAALGAGPKIARFRILSGMEDLVAARTDAIKMTGFQMLREQGYSEKAATYHTKRFVGTPDYSTSGAMHPAVKLATTFLNADLQHMSQSIGRAMDKPATVLPRLAAATALVMALQQWNWSHKDKDGKPMMLQVPFDERDRNFVILTGGTHQVASGAVVPDRWLIRKPDIMSYLVNPVENVISKALGHEERSARSLTLDALKGLTPYAHGSVGDEHPMQDIGRSVAGSINPMFRIPAEELNNRNFGTGAPIVGRPNIEDPFQATPHTPSIYQKLGEASGLSPQRIQHVASGLTGGMADSIAQQVDPLIRGKKPAPIPGSPNATKQIPVIGGTLAGLQGSNISQEEATQSDKYYGRLKTYSDAKTTFDYLMKTNPQKAQEFAQKNRSLLAMSNIAPTIAGSMKDLEDMRRQVESNTSMPEEARAKALANLAKARIRLMTSFNKATEKYR